MKRIYLDNAATTRTSDTALKAMLPYFTEEYGNPSSLHEAGQVAADAVRKARKEIAEDIGALPDEIYFTSGGSESDNQALLSAAKFGAKNGKKHIVTTAIEHHAVLNTLKELEKEGFNVTLVGADSSGIVDPEQISKEIKNDTCLVTVMYANNEIGTIQPISEIGKICAGKGVVFHTDAVQAAGHLKIDVKKENVDMLSMSAHKFGGPKGIGALYVKKGAPIFPLINGGAQEKGKRAGTENVPAIVGMAAAFKESCGNIEKNAEKITELRNELIKGILEIPHSALNGDRDKRLPGNASFCFEGIEGESLLLLLSDKGIFASSGSACTSGSLDPSHVLLAIGRIHDVAHGSLRLTLSESNTREEIEYTVNSVKEVVAYLRSISPVWRDLTEGKRKFIL